LAREKGKRETLGSVAYPTQASEILQGLEQCLIETDSKRKGRANLSLVVSDSVAAIAPLPWQDGLSSEAELRGYAQICFEKLGYDISGNWVLRVEYPRYGAGGLAYALPRDWMLALLAILENRQLRLTGVLPISALLFTGVPETARPGLTIVLIFEATQHGVLVFENGALASRDVEPFAQSIEKTRHRLLARALAGRKGEGKQALNLLWWAYSEIEFPKQVIDAHAIGAVVTQIGNGVRA